MTGEREELASNHTSRVTHYWKWGLVIGGFSVALIWGAWWGLERIIRRQHLPALERQIGRRVSIAELSWAWPPAIRLVDVRVDDLMTASEVRVRSDLSIEIMRPTLHWDITKDRTIPAASRIPAPSSSHTSRRRIVVHDATVILPSWRLNASHVALEVESPLRPMRIAARGVSLSSDGVSLDDLMLYAERQALSTWHVRLDAHAATISQPNLASQAVGPFSFEAEGLCRWNSGLHIQQGHLRLGALQIAFGLDVDPSRLAIEAQIPKTPCLSLLASLPPGFAPTLQGMQLTGSLETSLNCIYEVADPERTHLDIGFQTLCGVEKDPPRAPVSELLQPQILVGQRRIVPTPLSTLGPVIPAAYLAAEDSHFYQHHGFDFDNIRRALIYDLEVKRFARGASTISQQLVKNLYLKHDRNVGRKFEETVLTWLVEQRVPKKRILEWYLSIIETGPGIQGVEAAAQTYFGRPAKTLTPLQAAHLAALTPRPVATARELDGRAIPASWYQRLFVLLNGMQRMGAISRTQWLNARSEKLELRKLP